MQTMTVSTKHRDDWVDLTSSLKDLAHRKNFQNGLITVFVPHTTAGVTINENADKDVVKDLITTLDKLVPWQDGYQHLEGNSAAHMKATLTGSSVTVPVKNGQLQLGTWQGIFFCEYDGPRNRQVRIIFTPGEAREEC